MPKLLFTEVHKNIKQKIRAQKTGRVSKQVARRTPFLSIQPTLDNYWGLHEYQAYLTHNTRGIEAALADKCLAQFAAKRRDSLNPEPLVRNRTFEKRLTESFQSFASLSLRNMVATYKYERNVELEKMLKARNIPSKQTKTKAIIEFYNQLDNDNGEKGVMPRRKKKQYNSWENRPTFFHYSVEDQSPTKSTTSRTLPGKLADHPKHKRTTQVLDNLLWSSNSKATTKPAKPLTDQEMMTKSFSMDDDADTRFTL